MSIRYGHASNRDPVTVGDFVRVIFTGPGARRADCGGEGRVTRLGRTRAVVRLASDLAHPRHIDPACLMRISREVYEQGETP
jgi:hypothetical protein